MQFSKLIKNLKREVNGITDDSREVKKGYLFVAVKGLTVDGHKFIPQAIEKGAKVIVGEENIKLDSVLYVKVANSRRALGLLASAWYGNPSERLKVIGVTGTDGKTTTSNLIYWILKKAGERVGLISTINAKIGDKEYDTGFHVTNPEPILLQKLLDEMVRKGCEYAVLEVTSHGLDQDRVVGVKFDIGVLTNITHEHIDYHKTFENYVAAKGRLFQKVKYAFLNAANDSYKKIKPFVNRKAKIIKYNFDLLDSGMRDTIKTRFSEKYNLENASAAVEVAKLLKVNSKNIGNAVRLFPQLSGRMEEIKNKRGIRAIVDFAHTPNALESVLRVLKENKKNGRLIVVFGCAGERDIKKRELMPKVAVRLADISIFTAEDPRSEKIEDILNVMVKAATDVGGKEKADFYKQSLQKHSFYRIPERGEAIYFAINKIAKKGDTVVVCGKGHERSMAYNGVEYPWSDQEAVKTALRGDVKRIFRK